ncbi:hypothetical protein [Pseudomonas cremoricolorata]|uniref:hypothetical protein n=1 Tax=Pseudomonas cremoricolorata TaxID=157783 RepID=UPI0006767D89|nr:hypothetical protein [Pseudomonas cremoricolorata]
MNFSNPVVFVLAPASLLLGGYLLVRCIGLAKRMIFPAVKIRFAASAEPFAFHLPQPGRYAVNVVIPPMKLLIGVAHFSARFAITTAAAQPLTYRSYGRALFTVDRTDMAGKRSMPLGRFDCAQAGDFTLTCLNPETIRDEYQLEVAPVVPVLKLVPLILATLVAAHMTIGGLVISLICLFGQA